VSLKPCSSQLNLSGVDVCQSDASWMIDNLNRLTRFVSFLRTMERVVNYHILVWLATEIGLNRADSVVQSYLFLAERALKFLLQPVVDAFGMELVRTPECLDHLTLTHLIQADGAALLATL